LAGTMSATSVLARKWRPKTFAQLAGQEHVVQALSNALTQNRLHHAYLFTGTRGVGKTTIARIFAKSLNCVNGITAIPCGVCSACTEIDSGRFVDLIELDAASNTQVDNMRELLESALYAPTSGRFKVYIIDEVHMLSKSAFNAMLKTLEEPPAHVKFILATTDPQKIPVTVLSRCLQFNLKQLPPALILTHLQYVLGQENIPFEAGALALLSRAAQGSMRDALSLLDQAIAYSDSKVDEATVRNMLGAIDQSYLYDLLQTLLVRDGAGLLRIADDMAIRSLTFDAALQDLATLLHRVALAQTVPLAIAEDEPERARLLELAQHFSAEEVQLFYQIAIHGRNEIDLAPDEYAGFTMTLLRMLAFMPGGAQAVPERPATKAAAVHVAQAQPKLQAAPPVAVATPPATQPKPVADVVAANSWRVLPHRSTGGCCWRN
jgi:DNA polymerase-3 subunit gamma/tau